MEGLFWVVVAFVIYAGMMITLGVAYYGKNNTLENFFLGGRKLNSWVAAMSAQASDMSGWLLMGLPGAVYAFGTGQLWIAVGLAIGTALNWILVARRLRRYTITAGNSITIPEYLENRFRDTSKIIRIASAIFIFIFFAVYAASGFKACGTLFSQVFGISFELSLLIGVTVILIYTFLGGFWAVCWTDLIQGLLIFAAIIFVPILAVMSMGGFGTVSENVPPQFLNAFLDDTGNNLSFISLVSQLAWGLGYFGMPHILIRFMAIKSDKAVKKSASIAIIWVIFTLTFAVVVGIIGHGLTPNLENPETVFISMIEKVLLSSSAVLPVPLLGGFLLCAILAAIMSTADSQLLVTASAITSDIYKNAINKKASDMHLIWFGRVAVLIVSVVAFFIALTGNANIMGLVSNAWSGFGSTFGALILLSLYWKRVNRAGAAAGIISGGLTVIIWDYLSFGGKTLAASTGLYSLAPGFLISLIFIVIVSLMTKEPSKEIQDEFDKAMNSVAFE